MKDVDVIICSSGSELTTGKSTDTNSGWIATELSFLGFSIRKFLVLPDDPEILLEELQFLQTAARTNKRKTLVCMTGGLGPTVDDYTLSVICKLTNLNPASVKSAETKLKFLYRSRGKQLEDLLPVAMRQTQVPETSEILENKVGIAPGFFLFTDEHFAISCFPGVPVEMKEMFTKEFLPKLQNHFPFSRGYTFSKEIWNTTETSFQEEFIKEHEKSWEGEVIWGVTAKRGFIKGIFNSSNPQKIDLVSKQVSEFYGKNLSDDVFLEIHNFFTEKKLTLCIAESCTGGLVSKKLTDPPGSSAYFLGGFVTYSNDLKKSELGVSQFTLDAHGAVSEETAKEMVLGVFKKTKADFAISITGIAGPTGGTAEKPVGTVWVALSKRDSEIFTRKFYYPANRELIREFTLNNVLFLLYQLLKNDL